MEAAIYCRNLAHEGKNYPITGIKQGLWILTMDFTGHIQVRENKR